MQCKKIDFKLLFNIDNIKIISTSNNETIISSYNLDNKEIKVLIYNYHEKNAELEKPKVSSIFFNDDLKSYELISNINETVIYALVNDSVLKYVYSKSHAKKHIGASGDNVYQNSFYFDGMRKFDGINPTAIKISRNGSIFCIISNSDKIQIYDFKTFFDHDNNSCSVIETFDKAQMVIKDISPDASSLIIQSRISNVCILWDIEKNKKTIELIFSEESQIVDCLFGRIEAVSHIYNIYGIYNSNVSNKYWITVWNCSNHTIKHSMCIESRICNSISVSNEGRYVAVSCFDSKQIDIFISFNLQKLYTYSNISCDDNKWFCHFLPLSFSIDQFQHEFDLLSLYTSKSSTSVFWLYESMKQNYSVIWPISAAIVLIFSLFYFAFQFGL